MSVTLVALSAVSGVPLFIRHRGTSKPPSYNVVGSLNGVFMFGESQGTKVLDTKTPYSAITWKTYNDGVRLILLHGKEPHKKQNVNLNNNVCNANDSTNLSSILVGGLPDQKLLDLIFNSLILLLSIDALSSTANVERLKKDIKVCYPLVDVLLERCLDNSTSRAGPLFSQLLLCADTVLPPDNYNLQSEVGKWCESQCNSSYGCLVSASGRVLAASRTYWTLAATELVLLPMLLLAAPAPNAARDVPVYLPHKSPKMPFRLLGVKLTSQVWCMSVCGPSPSLSTVVRTAGAFWSPYLAGLETLAATQPYNMTSGARQLLDKAVRGLLVVNYSTKRCVSCVHLGPSNAKGNTTVSNSVLDNNKPTQQQHTDTISRSVHNSNDNRSNYGTETRSRKSLSSKKSQSPPRSQTNTLKSSSGKTPTTIHTYQTVELNISPVQPRRALSPHQARALSPAATGLPSGHQRALSPSSRPSSRVASGGGAGFPSTGTMSSATSKSPRPSSRALSPTGTLRASRALSPVGAGGARVRSPSPATLKRGTAGGGAGNGGYLSPGQKIAALSSVYRGLVGPLLRPPDMPVGDTPAIAMEPDHNITECYIWSGSCRVYVLQSSGLLLMVLLPPALPHTLARSVAYKTLSVFLKGKTPKI